MWERLVLGCFVYVINNVIHSVFFFYRKMGNWSKIGSAFKRFGQGARNVAGKVRDGVVAITPKVLNVMRGAAGVGDRIQQGIATGTRHVDQARRAIGESGVRLPAVVNTGLDAVQRTVNRAGGVIGQGSHRLQQVVNAGRL
jgi:hypothetical protein